MRVNYKLVIPCQMHKLNYSGYTALLSPSKTSPVSKPFSASALASQRRRHDPNIRGHQSHVGVVQDRHGSREGRRPSDWSMKAAPPSLAICSMIGLGKDLGAEYRRNARFPYLVNQRRHLSRGRFAEIRGLRRADDRRSHTAR